MSLKNKVYIILSFILVIFMIFLTFLYLSSHKKETNAISNVASTNSSTINSTSSLIDDVQTEVYNKSSINPNLDKKLENKDTETKTEKSSDNKNDKDNYEYISNYRYVYEAVDGDDFSVVSKLTGVDVDTLAKANSLSKDVVFKKGDRIFVP